MSMAEKFLGSSEEMTTMEGGRCYVGWQIGNNRQTTIVSIHNLIERIHHLTITVETGQLVDSKHKSTVINRIGSIE